VGCLVVGCGLWVVGGENYCVGTLNFKVGTMARFSNFCVAYSVSRWYIAVINFFLISVFQLFCCQIFVQRASLPSV
jgi:hypothetical protein